MSNPLVALAFGVGVGYIVQLVAARLRHNGEWVSVPFGRKIAMSATGAIAAFVVGLWVLDNPRPTGGPVVYRLWLYQTLAAWGGALVLDAGSKAVTSFGKLLEQGRRSP